MLLLYVATLCALLVFVVYPTLKVLSTPSWDNVVEVLTSGRTLQAARNSAVITLLSTTSATLLGLFFAFASTRRDIPFRNIFRVIGVLPLFAPPFMVAFAYILVFGRQGLITYHILGLDVNIFGWHGLWLAQTIGMFPLASVIIRGVLEGIHPSTEQAALTLGASETAALRTVLVPLALPGIIGAMLVVAITVLADFGNAAVIAGNYPVLATEAWLRMDGLGDLQGAAVIVSVLMIPAVALFGASRALLGGRVFTTVTGRGADVDQIATPAIIKWSVVVICSLTCALVLIVYVGILLAGMVNKWGSDWSLTFRHWLEVASYADELSVSIKIGIISGLVTALIGQIIAFLHSRSLWFRGALDFLAVLPGALPGVFIGVGFVLAFNAPPIELAGTIWIVVFALGFWHLPQAYQATKAALGQIHRSIEESARDLGASEVRLITDVYMPLLSRSLLASFIQSFIRSVSNVSVVVFMIAPGQILVSAVILRMIGSSNWSAGAALATVLLAITFMCVGVAEAAIRWLGAPARGSQL
ncbi:iron ABC transporter permease [Bosea sp. (in: a-proteobacteria)]|uniref:ABC transporter permease n=1 Tax=Bosea sp. (in: a-proteobacteria) TaxID=1871050 RepID=UPI0026256276|nr:iron ABC transporter permease [Bosea sp. (in: a-proteobacteria)]MCO5090741.1 iron ABC transporter permease [Bosea sp. (in: a-proteobacteria)]